MAKNKVSEWSSNPANNTDVGAIDIAEGCAPSGINNAMREMMAQIKDMQAGTDGDSFTCSGTLVSSGALDVTGGFLLDSSAGTLGQVMVSAGSGNTPTWGNAFVAGMIMMWSGSIATIPSGWYLCNGSNGTPDLRNRFVIGAYQDDSGTAKTTVTGSLTQSGGSKDASNVSHTHTASVTDPGHTHQIGYTNDGDASGSGSVEFYSSGLFKTTTSATTGISVGISTEGSSGTNANLPPYYALAFIMKG